MMPSSNFISQEEKEVTSEFNELIRRQDLLETEISQLKELFQTMKHKSDIETGRIHQRIDDLEEEVNEIRQTLNELKLSMNIIQTSIDTVKEHVSDINAKQDVTISAQDKFISQLWKAFFALLGVVTAAGGAIIAFLK